jgi:predicted ester cyclase
VSDPHNHHHHHHASADDVRSVARSVFAASDRNDLDTLRQHPGLHETVHYIPALWAAFPDLRHTIDQQFVADDVVTTIATARGTQDGVLLGLPPSGKEVTFMVISVDRVVDGTIVLHYGLPEWLAMLGPLGGLPNLATADSQPARPRQTST